MCTIAKQIFNLPDKYLTSFKMSLRCAADKQYIVRYIYVTYDLPTTSRRKVMAVIPEISENYGYEDHKIY
jgi:hypothetical protein